MPTQLPPRDAPGVAYLLDLMSIARGTFETIRPRQTEEGEPIAVTVSVVQHLVRLLSERAPRFLGICADTPVPTWHYDVWPEYHAKRSPPGPEFDIQIDRLIEVYSAHRIPVFRGAGWSADDFFGTLVPKIRAYGLRVVMVSKDQDLWQLIEPNDGVIAWPGYGPDAVGAADVKAKYEVEPEKLVDLMALAGDDDEAPGLPGIGTKHAARLVNRHGSYEEALRKWQWELGAKGKVTKVAEALRDGAAAAALSHRLVRLRDDAPVDFDLGRLRLGWDAPAAQRIRAIGHELGIQDLRTAPVWPKAAVRIEGGLVVA